MHIRQNTEKNGRHLRARRPDMAASYDSYFGTGLYDNRYPRPNRRVLRAALASLTPGGRFLDYGAGTGRYCFPLLSRKNVQGSPQISAVSRATACWLMQPQRGSLIGCMSLTGA